jgi:hypothetical protein
MSNKLRKTLWGLLAFSPWILFFIGIPMFIHNIPPDSIVMKEGKLPPFLIGFVVVGNLYVLLLFLIFLIYLGRMKDIDNEKKWLWRGLMFLGHVLAIPIYKNRYPLVCSAIGSNRFTAMCELRRISVEGPLNGVSTLFTFELI